MRFGDLRWGELAGLVGAVILAIGVFLPWYSVNNENAEITPGRDGCNAIPTGRGGSGLEPGTTCSAWETESVLRILLLLAAIAPFVLAWIIIRQHKLSWPRGELTAVIGITAVTLILVRGFIFKPGEPSGQIGLSYGWVVSLVGAGLILLGAVVRTGEIGGRKRKPPGVI